MPNEKGLKERQKNPRDEFYTTYGTIEAEIETYPKEVFCGKTIYLPCDAEWSNFFKYFLDNFEKLQLRGLYASSIEGKYVKITDPKDIVWKDMRDDFFFKTGDFRSQHARELMKEADIIITNPPFSLFLAFFQQCVQYQKKFLCIAYQAILSSKHVSREIIQGRVTVGNDCPSAMYFTMSPEYEITSVNGEGLASVCCVWLTNLPTREKHLPKNDVEDIEAFVNSCTRFTKFPEVINIMAIKDIPTNYDGVMGVPVTFFKYHNPKEYKIFGINGYVSNSHGLSLVGQQKESFGRLFIQKIKKSPVERCVESRRHFGEDMIA